MYGEPPAKSKYGKLIEKREKILNSMSHPDKSKTHEAEKLWHEAAALKEHQQPHWKEK